VSGREALDARRILGPAGTEVLVIGNHGLEWLEPGAEAPQDDGRLGSLRSAVAAVLERMPRLPGVEVEDKGLSATVHYRQAPDPEAARARLLTALPNLGDLGDGPLEIREGRRSLELRPVGHGDKGTALRALVERFTLRGLLVAGDDVTDLDMFRVARQLQADGLRSAMFGIAGGSEVPAEVAASVDILLPDPASFVRLLGQLAKLGA
jgi:trehalose 6-phosphate phosphatase